MTVKYYALLTNLGAAKLANAVALGTQLQITQMAVGDGGGVLPTPNASQTSLIGEKRRAPLNQLSIDTANSSQIIAEQIIPENEGGYWIREIGLFDADGTMIAVANCAETYKPLMAEGSGRTQTVRVILVVSSTEAVTLKIDPSVVLATRKYVDDAVIEVKTYADEVMRLHIAAKDPHEQYLLESQLSSATDSTSTTQAATSKAVKAVMDETGKKALLGGNTTQQFYAKDATADGHVVNQGQMNTALAKKANVNGNDATDFYVRNNGETNAAVNNARLNFVLGGFASLGGKETQPFAVGLPSAYYHAARLDSLNNGLATKADSVAFQSGSNGNGAWTKVASGGQWCRQNLNIPAKTNITWTYPASFPASPAIFITAVNGNPAAWSTGVGANNAGIYNNNDSTLNINILAIW